MAPHTRPQVDPHQLEEFRDRLRQRAKHPMRLVLSVFLRHGLVAFVLLFLILPILDGREPFGDTFTARTALIRGMAAVLMAAFSTFLAYRSARDTLRVSSEEHEQLLLADWRRWTGMGWMRRTLTIGAAITAGVGLPVGLLMALTFPSAELFAGSRPLTLLTFVGLTAVWAVPMAFGIRWFALRDYRSLAAPARTP